MNGGKMDAWITGNYGEDHPDNVDTSTCEFCGRFWYNGDAPYGVPHDNATRPPLTEYGDENSLCETCECEIHTCSECGGHTETADGETARAVDGCAECLDVPQCENCGRTAARADVGTVCRECGRGIVHDTETRAIHSAFEPAACPWCGARHFSILGTLGERVHYRCRNCGADSSSRHTVTDTRAAVERAADVSEQIDKGE